MKEGISLGELMRRALREYLANKEAQKKDKAKHIKDRVRALGGGK